MFSVEQKRSIAKQIQQILRNTGHPELPNTEIEFKLHVQGRFEWSWADIQNNSAVSVHRTVTHGFFAEGLVMAIGFIISRTRKDYKSF